MHPNQAKLVRGRITDIHPSGVVIRNEEGSHSIQVKNAHQASLGDVVQVADDHLQILTPNRTAQKTMQWLQHTLNPRRTQGVKIRSHVQSLIREFFLSRDFHETRTPLLVPCPGMEPHIRPFSVQGVHHPLPHLFLPTSPEFAMKRLLVGGLERVFQICPAFRDEPFSITHRPEFTMLEWYRAYAGYEEIMKDTEELFEFIALRLFNQPSLKYQNQEISVKTPWPRLKIRDLFVEHVGINLVECSTLPQLAKECRKLGLPVNSEDTWDDLYFKIWLNLIEPKLPADRAVFVTRYPASQAALSVVDSDPDGSRWARRFEVYAGGIELGNAFEELTDPVEQRRRFIDDMNLREEIYGSSFPKNPLDEEFLNALEEGMPPSGGIAVGVDRMVMLFANESDIGYTQWL